LAEADRRAVAIEVGIQNSGLGLLLIFNFFRQGLMFFTKLCEMCFKIHSIPPVQLTSRQSLYIVNENLLRNYYLVDYFRQHTAIDWEY
jgi:hypothetical protein